MIARNASANVLKKLSDSPVVEIIGPRQVGKTTLVKSLISQIPKRVVYLDLERPSDILLIRDPEIFLRQNQEACIVLDEIQHAPHLFPILRSFIDMKREPARFILLGSSSPYLLRNSSESLAGRITYIELMPFNLTEIYTKYSMYQHWFRGGFPNAFLASNDEKALDWLDDFIRSYIERDLPALGFTASPILTRRLWTMLAHFHGGIWNTKSFSKSLGITEPTVRRYVDFLEHAFIIHRLLPFHVNIKKRLIKSPKVYLRDSGLLHRLVQLSSLDALHGHIIIGESFEGYVIEQIRQQLPRDFSCYYYRTHDGSECDLVLVRGMKPIVSIEIKYTSTPSLTRGNTIAISDLGTTNNFIVTPESDDYQIREDVRVCSLPVFLKEYLPKIG